MKRIVKGVGKVAGGIAGTIIGSKKKKTEEAAPAATEQKGPIITPLGGSGLPVNPARRRGVGSSQSFATILSEKLGG